MKKLTQTHIFRSGGVLLLALAMLTSMLTVMSSCRPGGEEDGTGTGSADTRETAAPGSDTEPSTEAETGPAVPDDVLLAPTGFPAEEAGASSEITLSVADFGAKGDGVTDDGPAVSAAVRAAAEQHATLTFEAGKTYYIGTSDTVVGDQRGPIVLSGASGVTIDGQGATLKVTPGLAYFSFLDCTDVRIRGFVFDYSVPVYLVGTADKIRGNAVTFKTDIAPNMDEYDFSRVSGFAIKYNDGLQQRPHAYVGQMRRAGENTVTVEFPNGVPCSRGDKMFLPNPGVGHAFNAPVSISGCTGAVVCENVTIRAAATMSVVVGDNDAEIYFENTDLMPDTDDGREIHMVGWRDGFHCSGNRLPIHWDKCEVGVMFDDAFNIYGGLGYVTAVNADNTVTACHYGRYLVGAIENADIRAGDVLDFYNNVVGEYYGCATVREAVQNPNGTTSVYFEYGQDVRSIPVGAQIANRSTGAPGSTFRDCHFEGTFRFHRDLRFENTSFDILCMWIMVEDNGEGPLPGNIDFINCTLSGPPQIDCMNRASNKYFKDLGSRITDIGFWGCRMEGTLRSRSDAHWTFADTWTEDNLYTVKNARPQTVTAVGIAPADYDFLPGVACDWAYHTMPVSGAEPILVRTVKDETLRAAMENDDGFAGRVLRMSGDTLTPDALSRDKQPCLYRDGNLYTITLTVCSDKDGTCTLHTGTGTSEPIPYTAGQAVPMTFTYVGDGTQTGLSFSFTGGGTVYVGTLRVTMAENKDPTMNQLLHGHTFVWTDEVRFGEGTPVKVSDVADETVRNAVLGAQSGFTTGKVLHLTDASGIITGGDFTGLTDAAYFTPGQTYHISLDAYAASAVPDGAGVSLIARGRDGNGQVLIEDLFTVTGLCHVETDWTVGDTGETALALAVTGTSAQSADVYLGDFTVTAKLSYKPDHFIDVWPFAWPTAGIFHEGFLFDFTDGHLMDFGLWGDAYATAGSFNDVVYGKLRAAGFGERVYYVNTGFHLTSIEQMHPGGHRVTIVLEVYDGLGNLTEGAGQGVLVLRPMLNGEDTGAWLDCTVRVDPEDSQHLWLTYTADLTTDDALRSTEDIVIFATTSVEFVIGSIWVEMDK